MSVPQDEADFSQWFMQALDRCGPSIRDLNTFAAVADQKPGAASDGAGGKAISGGPSRTLSAKKPAALPAATSPAVEVTSSSAPKDPEAILEAELKTFFATHGLPESTAASVIQQDKDMLSNLSLDEAECMAKALLADKV